MAALMGKHGVAKASMAKGVAQEGQLALVEASHPFEATLQSIDFACLALQVGVQVGNRRLDCLASSPLAGQLHCRGTLDHLHLSQKKSGEVVFITLAE